MNFDLASYFIGVGVTCIGFGIWIWFLINYPIGD